jgi:hypothetical protein
MGLWDLGLFKGRRKTATSVAQPEPSRAAREAAARAEAAKRWEEQQAREHAAWIAAGVAGLERQRRLAELNGAWIPEDEGRGGLAEITLGDGERIDLGTHQRGRFS